MRDDFDRVLCRPGARGFHESLYLKANDPTGQGAFWIKHNLLAPIDRAHPRFGKLSAIVWKGRGQRPLVVGQVIEESQIAIGEEGLALELGSASLQDSRITGAVESDGHRIAWDLELLEGEAPMFLYPNPPFYNTPFPKKKTMTPRPRQLFRGTLEVDDEVVAVEQWVGLRGHNWGKEHSHTLAFGNANLWEQPGDWIFEAASARLWVGPVVTPLLSAAVLRLPKAEIAINQPRRWLNRSATIDFPSWSCTFRHPKGDLRARWTLDPEDTAGLRYLNPDGRVSYCYNTKFAKLELELDRGRGRERRSSHLAELEFLFPTPIPGIPLHGDDLLP